MDIFVYLELLLTFSSWAVFLTLNYFYNIVRGLIWRVNGINRQLVTNKKPENYKTSAHVKRILFRYTIGRYIRYPESLFVTVHEGFVHPERVLEDDCSFYAIDSKEAVFIQVDSQPDDMFVHDLFNHKQFHCAVKLITIPLNHFNKLAEQLEDVGARIIFLYKQTRCGGTLVTSLFRETGRCVCFNEPTCFSIVCKRIFSDNIWHGATARRVFRNTVRVLCKPYKILGENTLAYIIKPMFTDTITMEMAEEVFPNAFLFFIYRNPIHVAISLRRIGQVIKLFKLIIYLPNFANIVANIFELTGLHNMEYRGWTCTIHPEFEFGYRATCFTVYYYLQALKHGVKIRGLRYEDLVANEMQIIKNIFQLCQLPDSFLEKAILKQVHQSVGINFGMPFQILQNYHWDSWLLLVLCRKSLVYLLQICTMIKHFVYPTAWNHDVASPLTKDTL